MHKNFVQIFTNSLLTPLAFCGTFPSLTVIEVKNGSHPSKYKGFEPFDFLRENRNVLNMRNFLKAFCSSDDSGHCLLCRQFIVSMESGIIV